MSVCLKSCARFLFKTMDVIQRLPFVESSGESCTREAENAFKSSSPRREKIMKLFLSDSDTERRDYVEIFCRTKALHSYMATPEEKQMIPIQVNLKVGTLSHSHSFEVLHQIIPEISPPLQYSSYNQNAAKGFGITQIIIGTFCIVLSSILTGTTEDKVFPNSVGYGIWGGILIFLAGLMGVISAKVNPNLGIIIGMIAMSLVTACVSSVVFVLEIIEVLTATQQNTTWRIAHMALGITLVILAFVESVLSGINSTLCCRAVRCDLSMKALDRIYSPIVPDVTPATDYQDLGSKEPEDYAVIS